MKNILSRVACVESLENRTLLSSYFVSTSGSDSAAGSTSAPWKTLQKAADTAHAGDTVTVRAGTYAGMTLTGSAYPGGTASAPITFIAGDGSGAGNWQTSGVTINGFSAKDNGGQYAFINIESNPGYYVIEGFNVIDNGSTQKAGIRVANSHNDKILNCQVSGAFTGIFASLADGIVIQGNSSHDSYEQHGIYVNGTNGYSILNNQCYNNNWDGIHTNVLDGGNSINTNGVISGNVVYDNLLSGMDIDGSVGCVFTNNLAYGNQRHGVVLQNTNTAATPACANNVFVNNTFDASGGSSAWGIEVTSGNGANTTVFNNILFGSSGTIGGSTLPSSLKMSNNITSGSTSSLFVNPGSGDYHLKSGSAAIDAGTGSFNGVSAPSTDADGNARPQGSNYDIGAYEYASSGSTVTVPSAPTNLSAAAGSTSQINLSWSDNSTNETGFKIERATGTGSFTQIATTGAGVASYPDSGLSAGTQYSYRVRATNSAGDSAYTNTASATTLNAVTVPTAPSNLGAVASSSSQINLTWTDNSSNETGYKIERATGTGSFTQIATTGAGVASYADSGLSAGAQYSYRVRATNSAGDSAYTNTASATTLNAVTVPTAPSNLGAVASSSSQINLTWTDNSTNETGYKIDRATGTGAYTSLATLGAGVKSYSDAGLAAGTQYSYRVYAYNSAGNSAYSNLASATTTAATLVGWQNHSIAAQTGTFTAQFDAVPTVNNEDVVVGLSNGAASDYTNLAAVVRFNSTGTIDARNGANYVAAASVGYAAGTSYHFRLVVNVATRTYSAYVTAQGGSEILLGGNYAFRTEQAAVSTLNNWAQCALTGGATISNFTTASTDMTQPAVTAANFLYQVSPNQLTVTFSENVSASLSTSSLHVVNLTSGAAVSVTAYSYNSATNTATFSLPTGLADANYQATLGAASVSDAAGNHLATGFTYNFFVLAGDVNHDGVVDFNDLNIIAANWGGAGKVFSQGDLNYDGTVNSADMAIVTLNWHKSLLA